MNARFVQTHARVLFVGGLVALIGTVVVGFMLPYGDPLDRLTPVESRVVGDATVSLYEVRPLEEHETLDVGYSLGGNATLWIADCAQRDALLAGGEPAGAAVKRSGRVYGSIELGPDALPSSATCAGAVIAFVEMGKDSYVQAYIEANLYKTPGARILLAVGGVAAAALLVGAFSGAGMLRPELPPTVIPGESMLEAFLRLSARAESWLARTRRYLLALGVLALVPAWAFVGVMFVVAVAGVPPEDGGGFLLVAIGATIVLLSFSAIWFRRFREIDHELRTWRERISRLRDAELDILGEA